MRKTTNLLALIFVSSLLIFTACDKEKEIEKEPEVKKSVLPSSFSIDIPSAISADFTNRSANSDTLNGGEIYRHLRGFIRVGEASGQIIEGIINTISVLNINQAMNTTYTSNEDNREKTLIVEEGVSFESVSYEFKMTISDTENNKKGLQIFWNRSPIVGVAIIKPHNINYNNADNHPDAIYRIDYSESGSLGYDKHMAVTIANRTLNANDIYGLDNLKMFVGKKDDIVEVYGNSNHPNAEFFSNDETGFDWAFVAASNRLLNIGVAEVGLPPNTLNSEDRTVILVDNAIKTVFNNQISNLGYEQEDIDRYLYNTDAPGYFNNGGFVQGGTAPSADYSEIENKILNLKPYNPMNINNLSISFQ